MDVRQPRNTQTNPGQQQPSILKPGMNPEPLPESLKEALKPTLLPNTPVEPDHQSTFKTAFGMPEVEASSHGGS